MFSQQPQPPAVNSARSSRRRPRPTSSEGSVSQPKAKRQRSALSEQTFTVPDGPPEMQEVKQAKGNGTLSKREPAKLTQTPRRDLAVRGKKPKAPERASKGDGSVTLVSRLLLCAFKDTIY
jgi:nuclear pore complex protein Nup133